MNDLGKLLVVGGLIMAAVGALLWSGFGRGWLGRLPGDVHYSRDNFSFHFPIVTCPLPSGRRLKGYVQPEAEVIRELRFGSFWCLI